MTKSAAGALLLSLVVFAAPALGAPTAEPAWPDSIFAGSSERVEAIIKAHPRLVGEAEQYLLNCDVLGHKHEACLANQYSFVLDYIYAIYNHSTSQQNIAGILSDQRRVSGTGWGIDVNVIQGCAWGIASVNSGSPGLSSLTADNAKDDCEGVPASLSNAVQRRAKVILQEIDRHLKAGNPPYDIYDGY